MNQVKLITLNEKTLTAMARVFKFGRYQLLRGQIPNKYIFHTYSISVKYNQSLISTLICGNSGCVTHKAQRQGIKNLPPIADSVVRRERINYVDNSHIRTNLDCFIAPMSYFASFEAGVFFSLKKG